MKDADTRVGDSILELANVEASYGPVQALRGVTLSVPKGRIVTVLGANGAGKSTVLKTISGIIDPSKGQVRFEGGEIQSRDPAWIVRRGMFRRQKSYMKSERLR